MEAKVMLAKFVKNFEFDLDPNQDFSVCSKTTLRPRDGVKLTLKIRK